MLSEAGQGCRTSQGRWNTTVDCDRMMTGRGKPKHSDRNLPYYHTVQHSPTRPALASDPDLRGENPISNHLRCRMTGGGVTVWQTVKNWERTGCLTKFGCERKLKKHLSSLCEVLVSHGSENGVVLVSCNTMWTSGLTPTFRSNEDWGSMFFRNVGINPNVYTPL
jgi:hypothetical protein